MFLGVAWSFRVSVGVCCWNLMVCLVGVRLCLLLALVFGGVRFRCFTLFVFVGVWQCLLFSFNSVHWSLLSVFNIIQVCWCLAMFTVGVLLCLLVFDDIHDCWCLTVFMFVVSVCLLLFDDVCWCLFVGV